MVEVAIRPVEEGEALIQVEVAEHLEEVAVIQVVGEEEYLKVNFSPLEEEVGVVNPFLEVEVFPFQEEVVFQVVKGFQLLVGEEYFPY